MKRVMYLLFLSCAFVFQLKAQVKVGDNPTTINTSAVLDVESTSKGFLPPRMTTTQRNAIANPATGLVVFNTTKACLEVNLGTAASPNWQCLAQMTDVSSNGTATVSAYGGSGCTGSASITGSMTQGTAVSGVTMALYANVTQAGTYNISASQNGVVFSKSGSFASTGCQLVTLTSSGTPTNAGATTWTTNTSPAGSATATVNSNTSPSTNGTGIVSAYGGSGCTGSGSISGTMTAGTAVSGVTMTLYANVTQVGSYAISTTANGVTFSGSGTFTTTGCQAITLAATGTPTTAGSTTWTTNTTPSGSATATVAAAITIPATITLAQNQKYFVASAYDQDYLPYIVPTAPATTSTQAADGSNEATTVNVQGTITTTGITIKLPVTASGTGTLPAFSSTITIPSALTQDGISRDLTLSWASQAYTSSTTSITATIKSVGGTLNVKKLDVNAGIGNDYAGVLLGSFSFPYNNGGNMTTYTVRVIPGIPDRMFGVADNNGSSTSHTFLYLPVTGADGKIWLNNNLGADYANLNHASFNPSQQATSDLDFHAMGSLFQWGRRPDGHELMNYTSATSASPVYSGQYNGPVSTLTPSQYQFIYSTVGSTYGKDWYSPTQGLATWYAGNDPCPNGFHVPTRDEFGAFVTAAGQSLYDSNLKVPLSPQYYTYTGYFIFNQPSAGDDYGPWTAISLRLTSGGYTAQYDSDAAIFREDTDQSGDWHGWGKTDGFPIRCVQD